MDILTNRNFCAYAGVSTALAVYNLGSAFATHPTFYSACMALSEGLSPLVFGNGLLVVGLSVALMVQRVFFGELRLLEREHVAERAWGTVISSLVALAMFRHENMALLCGLSLVHLFLVVFHWIAEDRIDFLFQRAVRVADVLHSRAAAAAVLLLLADWTLGALLLNHSFRHAPDIFVVFGLQIFLLLLLMTEVVTKAVFNMVELAYLERHPDEEVWEPRAVYLKVSGIIHSFFTLGINCLLCYIFYGPSRVPIHLAVDMFQAVKMFVTQCKDFMAYLRAAEELDGMLRDAVAADLVEDCLCIICREDMEAGSGGGRKVPKVLACGHVIHLGCLKGWMERSRVCPMCRQPVRRETEPLVQPVANAEPQPVPAAPLPIPTAPLPIPTAPLPIPTAPLPTPVAPLPTPVVAPHPPSDWVLLPLSPAPHSPTTYNLKLNHSSLEVALLSVSTPNFDQHPLIPLSLSPSPLPLTSSSSRPFSQPLSVRLGTPQEQVRQISRDISTMRLDLDTLMAQLSELNARLDLEAEGDLLS